MKKATNYQNNNEWINLRFQKNKRKIDEIHVSRILFFFVGIVHIMAVFAVLKN